MPYFNPLHPRKLSKIFTSIPTFFMPTGTRFTLQRNPSSSSLHDETIIPLTNGHISHTFDNDNHSWLYTILSNLTLPFRTRYKIPHTYQRNANGVVKSDTTDNLIYHQINLEPKNDENNNHSDSFIVVSPNSSSSYYNSYYNYFTDKNQIVFNMFILICVSLIYFLWFIFVAGISLVHLIIYSSLLFLYLVSDRTRRFALAILIYFTYLLFYDALHLIPNYTVSNIHIEDIYLIEKKFFGIYRQGQLITLNEYFKETHIPFFDVFTGLCYLNWIPIPVAYSMYLYRYKSKRDYMDFAFTFLLTNLIGFVVYYIIPAAPPWYVEIHGFQFDINARGNPAGFIHFDEIIGMPIFSSMYSKNANVFAAIPSLHAAYPLITVLYGSLSKKLWLHILFVGFTMSVWFSAVYSRHHYVLDVLAGAMCALTAYILYRLLNRIPPINRLLGIYNKLI